MARMPNIEPSFGSKIDFSRKLIKGKITEVIFEEMFKTSDNFTILPLGYEHTTPILAQYQHQLHVKKVLDNLRNAPDFALISNNRTEVYLVEVKYRNSMAPERIKEKAKEILSLWNPSYLFIASKDGFYFDPCNSIVNNNGMVSRLTNGWINTEVQSKYLSLLNEFIN